MSESVPGPPAAINDETVEAAARALLRAQGFDPQDDRPVGGAWLETARLIVASAVPYIEAGLRERIAAEFESRDVPGLHWVISLEDAARVARGTLSADHTVASDLPGSDSTAPTPEGVA